ncbi:CsiV family protein [Legionella pneumophila]|uniref:CsiV family protein n=1 Tax=Legionella pneumophila TaxID=446 RepID=UPI000770A269|nr:CsiV family protein [Legionella pneumophila]CZJ43660.1 Protein of uncharacterised function (DUF2803) [Legionella pneumophila]CZJ50690.1 Protein of uncharacterised function (DUF2803) [Legionella pneumophila]CZJ52148.1 Protein of uncharacterised function (DUF2803) [Legionella pneumophila]CZJ54009.1 Protein of uncharacterised function (DUF2803) [Legionella pneumophila]CZJ54917.1 Protein of uncharacterised function (DUF2803) [Legionella pneumophila]
MIRLLIITISVLCSGLTIAKSSYQIDLILFAQPQSGVKSIKSDSPIPLIPVSPNAIQLHSDNNKKHRPYTLLPRSQSKLSDQYYLLSRKSQLQILGHYSWRQPAKSNSLVALPKINHNGWQIQGTLKVRQSNYYLFDADLQCLSPGNQETSFTVSQKQRLKGSTIYYLDHPQLGMLVKIHKIAS